MHLLHSRTRDSVLLAWLALLAAFPAGAQTVEVIASFSNPPAGARAGLVEGADGALYGASMYGGNGLGTVYRITTDGQLAVVHAFSGTEIQPVAPLVRVGADLYGTTAYRTTPGWTRQAGSVFRLSADGQLTTLHEFNGSDGQAPFDGLTLGSDGFLYGTTQSGGLYGKGTVFKMSPEGLFTKIYDFGGVAGDGNSPRGELVEGEPGVFYGVTQYGGAYGGSFGFGTLFKVTGAGVSQVLYSFPGLPGGRYPVGRLYRDASGNLWGTTGGGGPSDYGTVFQRDALTGSVAVVHAFAGGTAGAYPYSGLTLGPDGRLWGATGGIYSSGATVFSIGMAAPFGHQAHHVFAGLQVYARGQLLLAGGDLYGTTEGPGSGSVYRIRSGAFQTVRAFAVTERGWSPQSLAVAADGTVYGTTGAGGERGLGTAFRIGPDGAYETLHAFEDSDGQGRAPGQTKVAWSETDQVLFGVRSAGGARGGGTLFSLTPDGLRSDLFAFNSVWNDWNGRGPAGAPLVASDGRLYGTTSTGGGNGWGTVYSAKKDGSDFQTHAHLYSATGTEPLAPLVEASDGLIYGTTIYNGGRSPEVGSVFRIGKLGGPVPFQPVHHFSYSNGYSPDSGLAEVASGRLSGVASGGVYGKGVLYELTMTASPSYPYTIVRHFAGGAADGSAPHGELVAGWGGFHYGVTIAGGASDQGVVYRLRPGGADYSLVHAFSGADGWAPLALAKGPAGDIYGIAGRGGPGGGGVVFRVRLSLVCDAGGPYEVDEGSSVTLTAGCDPAATLKWDLDGDGDFDDATGESADFPPATLPSPDGPRTFTVRVRAKGAGELAAEFAATVNVRNVAPAVKAEPGFVSLIAGETLRAAGAFADPGPDTWTATVDYADGSGPQSLGLGADKSFSLSHTYAVAGDFAATVTVTDDDGGVGTARILVSVASAAESIQGLIEEVRKLVGQGSLNGGQGNSLIAKLEAALKQLAKGNTGPAINQLQAFVNEVTAYIQSGKLTPAEGQPLIDIANRAIGVL